MVKIFQQILSEYFRLIKKEFLEEIKGKETRYSFMIANTDPARKPGVNWWSFIDTDEEGTLFFSIHLVAMDS